MFYAGLTNAREALVRLIRAHIATRAIGAKRVAAHVAESAAPWNLPLMIVCHGAKGRLESLKTRTNAHIDEVSKYREVSCANFCTSQL